MIRLDERFSREIERAVGRIEDGTRAEIVVVAAPRSGSYRDLAVAVGAGAAWIVLLLALFLPPVISPAWVAVEVPLAGVLFAWLVDRTPALLRPLASARRRDAQVRAAARAGFVEHEVGGTRERTGVLVYVSLLERRFVVLPDAGAEAAIPAARWNAVRWNVDTTEGLLAGLEEVGRILAAAFPIAPGDRNEIPDRPRILE